jgi:RimJ/RimL family protein N-acetyltransferase
MQQPEITARDVLLRPWRHADEDEAARAWSDPEILRWIRYGTVVPTRENVDRWVDWNLDQWQFGLRAGFAVCAADGGGLVGSVMLRDFGRAAAAGQREDTGEAGYWIVPDRRGRGLAAQALGALSRWAFSSVDDGGLGLRRIQLTHSVANPASCRVAVKAGFRNEGTMRESFRYADGAWHDEHLHARLSSDPVVLVDPVDPGH